LHSFQGVARRGDLLQKQNHFINEEKRRRSIMFYMKVIVRKHERALLFRDGDFVKFLEPGVYRFATVLHKIEVQTFDLSVPIFGHRLQDFLVEQYRDQVERYFDIVETDENEIAIPPLRQRRTPYPRRALQHC
jgi:hypothetical protein